MLGRRWSSGPSPLSRHPTSLLPSADMTGRAEADLDAKELTDAVSRRPADRRPFGDRRVAEETLRRLRRLLSETGEPYPTSDRVTSTSPRSFRCRRPAPASETTRIDE